MKVDVEGFEYPLLNKLLEEDLIYLINSLYIEWHWKKIKGISENNHNKLIAKLKEKGLEINGQFDVLAKEEGFAKQDWKMRQAYEISAWGQADMEKIQKQKATIIKNLSIFPIKDFKNKIIVDVGSGPQGWMEDINAKERIAIDPLMDKYHAKGWKLKEKNYLHLISEGEKLPILTEYADIVFCFNALSHTRNPLQVIREIYRILNKDGLFYFYHSVSDETMAFHLHYKISKYLDIIIQQGFKIKFKEQKEIKNQSYHFIIFEKMEGIK